MIPTLSRASVPGLFATSFLLAATSCARSSATSLATADASPPSTSAALSAAPATSGVDPALASVFAAHQVGCREPQADDCILLGVDFAFGRGVAKDEAKAAQIYRAACEAKSSTGCTFVGGMHAFGRGVPKEKWKARGLATDTLPDIQKKASIYRYACDAGDAYACRRLGLSGNTADYARAAKLYREQCEKSDMAACAALGELEMEGQGVSKNPPSALARFEASCDGQDGTGCLELGYVYQQGRAGRAKDPSKAVEYLVHACELGEDMGCEEAGHMYEDGRGIKADRAAAKRVYKLACDRGDSAACGAYKRVGGT